MEILEFDGTNMKMNLMEIHIQYGKSYSLMQVWCKWIATKNQYITCEYAEFGKALFQSC